MAVTKYYNGFPPKYREKQGYAVYKMFKNGQLDRPTECIGCINTTSTGAVIMAHNENYHTPLKYVGICFHCHMAVHYRFKDIRTWIKWCDLTANGWTPPHVRDYNVFLKVWKWVASAEVEQPQKFTWLHTLPHIEPNYYESDQVLNI
jgi:hypothetical protein